MCQLMRSTDESVALRASQEILDRGWGKPTQHVEAEVSEKFVFELPAQAESEEAWQQLN
jgi:hypothetical protein